MVASDYLSNVAEIGPAVPVKVRSKGDLPAAWVRWLGGFRFELLVDFQLEVDADRRIIIIEGFTFDGASVPRPVWRLISPVDLGVVAPLVHDWLYRTGGEDGEFSRADADKLFMQHMKAEGIIWWRRKAAYAAVRLFGRGSWQG